MQKRGAKDCSLQPHLQVSALLTLMHMNDDTWRPVLRLSGVWRRRRADPAAGEADRTEGIAMAARKQQSVWHPLVCVLQSIYFIQLPSAKYSKTRQWTPVQSMSL